MRVFVCEGVRFSSVVFCGRRRGTSWFCMVVFVFVFGPSAVGKSFLSDAKAAELFGSAENAVEVDGAHFREEHRGWQAVRAHGYAHSMLHEEAWPLFKKYAGSTKLKVS